MKEFIVPTEIPEEIEFYEEHKCQEIVRCKDCKFHHASEKLNKCWCEKDFIEGYHSRDWFCADGERKTTDGQI